MSRAEDVQPDGYIPVAFREHPVKEIPGQVVRTFETGATRNVDTAKLDFEGFLCPRVLRVYAEYMNTHRTQADGTVRSSDNWQKGIPSEVYMKSLWRHFHDAWSIHRGHKAVSPEDGHEIDMREALAAMMFNTMGLLHEVLKEEK